jgi:hypothetical protein
MIFIPGSSLSANDQLDNGPVMLRTATQISSKELKGIEIKLCMKTSLKIRY